MDIEFHYWVTGIIANRAGFSPQDAATIAYCSQYVDDNDVSLQIESRENGKSYGNFVSQTMNILKPKTDLMRIYPIFHFVPGEPDAYSARRRDGKMHVLNTTPNNELANALLDEAFKSGNDVRLYRIGVATHAFADTWAHQNFVGYYDYFNNIGLDPKPDIGHSDAEHHPDWPAHRWDDNRLIDNEVNNKHRFLSASEALFHKYCDYLHTSDANQKWQALEKDLVFAIGKVTSGSHNQDVEQRISRYKELTTPWLKNFNEADWFNDAIETEVRGLRDSKEGIRAMFTIFKDKYHWRDGKNKDRYQWYKFQEAVKEHERFAIGLLRDRFNNMGLDIASI